MKAESKVEQPRNHAIEILEEREMHLRAYIRKCDELSHLNLCGVGNYKNDKRMMDEIRAAIETLTKASAQ